MFIVIPTHKITPFPAILLNNDNDNERLFIVKIVQSES